jgi:hypothetical protein
MKFNVLFNTVHVKRNNVFVQIQTKDVKRLSHWLALHFAGGNVHYQNRHSYVYQPEEVAACYHSHKQAHNNKKTDTPKIAPAMT